MLFGVRRVNQRCKLRVKVKRFAFLRRHATDHVFGQVLPDLGSAEHWAVAAQDDAVDTRAVRLRVIPGGFNSVCDRRLEHRHLLVPNPLEPGRRLAPFATAPLAVRVRPSLLHALRARDLEQLARLACDPDYAKRLGRLNQLDQGLDAERLVAAVQVDAQRVLGLDEFADKNTCAAAKRPAWSNRKRGRTRC